MAEITNSFESIKSLARIMEENNLNKLSVEIDGLKIELEANREHMPATHSNFLGAPSHPNFFVPPPVYGAHPVAPHNFHQHNYPVHEEKTAAESGNIVKSPIIGTFYAAPSPEKPPFVKVGDKVEKGQVICIVESMKLMNEIASEFSGIVAEIYVKDGEPVEFEQKIMRIK